MSKWYKVDLLWFNSDTGNSTEYNSKEIIRFVNEELQYEGRHKRTIFVKSEVGEWIWCFKFKDESAAMAFKLRWI